MCIPTRKQVEEWAQKYGILPSGSVCQFESAPMKKFSLSSLSETSVNELKSASSLMTVKIVAKTELLDLCYSFFISLGRYFMIS